MTPGTWGGATHRGDTLYLHLKPFAGSVTIPGVKGVVGPAVCLGGGVPTVVQTASSSLKITLPAADIDSMYTVVKIILNPKPAALRSKARASAQAARGRSQAKSTTPVFQFGDDQVYDLRGEALQSHESKRGFAE
jgi:hypothetical protein